MRPLVTKLPRTRGPAALVVAAGLVLAQCGGAPPDRPVPDRTALDRTVLPIPEPKRPVYTELDAQPFFAYYAPGATHAPHHVPKQ
jgi:hypothetical protein